MTIDDPYAVLGVSPTVSAGDLKRVYHRLSHEWHPDHHMQASDAQRLQAEQMFKKIGHAYVIVSTALRNATVSQAIDLSTGQPVTADPVSSVKRTLREIQLEAVAFACSASRLMIIAQNWTIHPHKFRREVSLVCRILSDAVVWGQQAFPGGFNRAWQQYLYDDNLLDQENNVRQLMIAAMDALAHNPSGNPDLSLATWTPVFRLIDPHWGMTQNATAAPPGRTSMRPPVPMSRSPQGDGSTSSSFSRIQAVVIVVLSAAVVLLLIALAMKLHS